MRRTRCSSASRERRVSRGAAQRATRAAAGRSAAPLSATRAAAGGSAAASRRARAPAARSAPGHRRARPAAAAWRRGERPSSAACRRRAPARTAPARCSRQTLQRGVGRALALEDRVDRAARRLVGALHRREVGVRADVVRGEEEVRDARRRVGPVVPRAGGVDEQRLEVRRVGRVGEADRRIEEPGDDVVVARASRRRGGP